MDHFTLVTFNEIQCNKLFSVVTRFLSGVQLCGPVFVHSHTAVLFAPIV